MPGPERTDAAGTPARAVYTPGVTIPETPPAVPGGRRTGFVMLGVSAVLWVVVTVHAWLPPLLERGLFPLAVARIVVRPVDIVAVVVTMFLAGLASVFALLLLVPRWWILIPTIVVFMAPLLTLKPAGLWWSATLYHSVHSEEFSRLEQYLAATPVASAPGGTALPADLAHLSATGSVSSSGDGVFLPVWVGVPNGAGGFFLTDSSPAGADLGGVACTAPTRVEGRWWACGMPVR